MRLIRNPRGTNWGSFREDLRDQLERGPEMDMKSEAGLELAIHWVQEALISAYEDNCPLRPVKTGSCLPGDWLCSSYMTTGKGSVYT